MTGFDIRGAFDLLFIPLIKKTWNIYISNNGSIQAVGQVEENTVKFQEDDVWKATQSLQAEGYMIRLVFQKITGNSMKREEPDLSNSYSEWIYIKKRNLGQNVQGLIKDLILGLGWGTGGGHSWNVKHHRFEKQVEERWF